MGNWSGRAAILVYGNQEASKTVKEIKHSFHEIILDQNVKENVTSVPNKLKLCI